MQINWKLKGLAQKGLSLVPGGGYVNNGLQKRYGGLRNFENNIAEKVEDWRLSFRYLQDVGFATDGASIVEIGTGWYPTLPLCFSLAGAGIVITYDVSRHIDSELSFRMVAGLEPHLDSIAEACGSCRGDVRTRYSKLRRAKDLNTLLEAAGIEYHAPADARATGLPPSSIDLVYSNSVLEHVPMPIIQAFMHETMRMLRPGGLALHNVGCNDHYAFVDCNVSFVNYLRYSEAQWRKWNNRLQYQNRLRAPEFLELARRAGLDVIYSQTAVRPGTREALATFEVASEFQRFDLEDLAITTVDFISRKPCLDKTSNRS